MAIRLYMDQQCTACDNKWAEIERYRFNPWILHESEAFIGKASKGDVVVLYFEPLATQHMKASGSPNG